MLHYMRIQCTRLYCVIPHWYIYTQGITYAMLLISYTYTHWCMHVFMYHIMLSYVLCEEEERRGESLFQRKHVLISHKSYVLSLFKQATAYVREGLSRIQYERVQGRQIVWWGFQPRDIWTSHLRWNPRCWGPRITWTWASRGQSYRGEGVRRVKEDKLKVY